MKKGQYVRCPIVFEFHDESFPRNFVLGQIENIDEISETAEVSYNDLQNAEDYYEHLFQNFEFPINKIKRCFATKNSLVETEDGDGKILSYGFDNSEDEENDEDCYYFVQLDNGTIKKYYESELAIDCIAPNYSPLNQLCEYEFQNPSWYARRFLVSQNMHVVNNMVYGFKILSGCRNFLMLHQINSITRAFETSPIRYILADEVGLGKTIEAGSIVKVLASENLDLRVLYLMPAALINQWKNEMKYKFNINLYDDELDVADANHYAVAYENLQSNYRASSVMSQRWDVLVVDEVHRSLTDPILYNCILCLSQNTSNALLLSATPVQDRKEEYLKLLTLLNPKQYEKMSIEDFSELVKIQSKIQKFVNKGLRYLKRYEDYYDEFSDMFEELSEMVDDDNLNKLIEDFDIKSEDLGKSSVEQILSYISENYRIERKIIRNRREMVSETLASRILQEEGYEQKSASEGFNERNTYEALLQYLEKELSSITSNKDEFFRKKAMPLLSAFFSSPWALKSVMDKLSIYDELLSENLQIWKIQYEEEFEKTEELLDDTPEKISSRLLKILNFIEFEIGTINSDFDKIVIFSNYEETLRQLANILSLREIGYSEFYKSLPIEELENSVFEFQNNPKCRVILCDESGGEGRNFQNADWVIHIDLPWTANAIEQRIGRLDRLGRNKKHLNINSIVFYAKDTIEEQLFKVWNDGLDIFHKSLSGMEIITSELNDLIFNALKNDLHNGLINILEDIHTKTERVRRQVRDEQNYDSASEIYKPLKLFIENMLRTYNSTESNVFQDAMLTWASQAGLKSKKTENEYISEFHKNQFIPQSAKQTLLIPPDWSFYDNSNVVRKFNVIKGTFDRETAINREDYIFYAPSDPLFESITLNAINSCRGRCCAFATYDDFDFKGFIFIFNIEPDINYLLNKKVSLKLLAQFRMCLPVEQFVIPIPLDGSENICYEQLYDILDNRKQIHSAINFGKRSNSSIEKFMEKNPPELWVEYVKDSYEKALKIAREKFDSLLKKDMLENNISRILHGYKSEYIYLKKNLSDLKKLTQQYGAIEYALKNAVFELDSCCFLRVNKDDSI